MAAPQRERRELLERLMAGLGPPLYLTPMTLDRGTAARWLDQFEGAGLDGVVAKPPESPYQPGKRVMIKVKHIRTADCVVAGFRWHKTGKDAVGSLLLGLYDDRGVLQHVGVTSSFTMARRKAAGEGAGAAARRTRSRVIPGAPGRRRTRAGSAGCPARRAAGAPARTCPGNPSASSGCAR